LWPVVVAVLRLVPRSAAHLPFYRSPLILAPFPFTVWVGSAGVATLGGHAGGLCAAGLLLLPLCPAALATLGR